MEIGTEISQKIRAAIKAKLVDLGAYVDDELPDYIMVMVANKKTQQQMAEDLSLFLANNTHKFTTWLHSLLDKLQSLTVDPFEDPAVQMIKQVQQSSQIKPASPVAPPVDLDITEQTDEFAEEMEKVGKKKVKPPDEPVIKPPPIEVVKTEPVPVTTASHEPRATHKVSPPKRNTQVLPSRSTHAQVSTSSTSTSRKRKALGSTIGSVICRPESEDEGYDPHFPSVGNVASVIRVTARRSSVPKTLQANSSLLMRAMHDAQKSVKSHRAIPEEPVAVVRTKSLMSRTRRQDMIRKLAQTVQEEYDPDDNYQLDTSDDGLNLMSASEDSRQFQTSPDRMSDLESDYEPELQHLRESGEENSDTRRIIKERKDEPQVTSPRFIVTLDGIDPKSMRGGSSQDATLDSESGTEYSKDLSLSFVTSDSEVETENCTSPVKKAPRLLEKCKFYPGCKNGTSCPYHHPTIPCKTFPKCKFGDKCLYVHPLCKFDAVCSKPACPFSHCSKKSPAFQSALIPKAYILAKPKFVSVMPVAAPPQKHGPTSPREVTCKFYPQCTNMNCPFNHPMPCRFGSGCKNTNCSFYHQPLPKGSQLKWRKSNPNVVSNQNTRSNPAVRPIVIANT